MIVRNLLARKGLVHPNNKSRQSVKETDSLKSLVSNLVELQLGALVVVDETGELCGIVSERDVIRYLDKADGTIGETTIADIMTRNVTTAAPEDNLEDVMQIMTTGHFRHVPIVEGDEIKGVLSIRDVVEAVLYDRDHENQSLKEYVLGLR